MINLMLLWPICLCTTRPCSCIHVGSRIVTIKQDVHVSMCTIHCNPADETLLARETRDGILLLLAMYGSKETGLTE
jgi:hypothetical protein